MDKILAKEIIDKSLDNSLYDSIVCIDMKSNRFNISDYNELLLKTMFLYHLTNGIESVSLKWPVPYKIDRDISYADFCRQLEGYEKYPLIIDAKLLPNVRNHFDNVVRLAASKLLDMGGFSWTRVYSRFINGTTVNETGKIFISVDNKDLYRFANLLLLKFLENGLSTYEFKLNDNIYLTRRDNVVIYFEKKDFELYVSMINQIISENPDIQLNSPHIFGYPINDYIRIGFDFDDGNKSFTEEMCRLIKEAKRKGKSTDEILDYLEDYIKNVVNNIMGINGNLGKKMN